MKTGLPAIADSNTRIFILGSLPGDKSIRDGRYYAHHTNQLWKVIGAIAGQDLHALSYERRLHRLAQLGIGLWDVINAARREGSSDAAIRDPKHNPISGLKQQYPSLEAIAFNGGTAAKAGRRLLADVDGVHLYDLVSSSGAAGTTLSEKISRWRVIERHLKRSGELGQC